METNILDAWCITSLKIQKSIDLLIILLISKPFLMDI